jgi:hypothetical protein
MTIYVLKFYETKENLDFSPYALDLEPKVKPGPNWAEPGQKST